MKKKHNEGFSLVETLVAITILALIVIPTCSGIVMAFRMNAKADELMQAQLAVSSAVETLMAEGIEKGADPDDYKDRFEAVTVTLTDKTEYFAVTVVSTVDTDVCITTSIRAVTPAGGGA